MNPTTLKARIQFIYDGGAVSRFHTVRSINPDNDARHSFGVAWLIYLLTEGLTTANLLMAGLSHDLAEQTVGDVPAPAKRSLGIGEELNALEDKILADAGFGFTISDREQRILKLADNLDGLMYCAQELRMGNRFVAEAGERYWQYIQRQAPLEGPEMDISNAIYAIFKEARE